TSAGLEAGLWRVFAGEYVVVELPTLEAEVGGERQGAGKDVAVARARAGAGLWRVFAGEYVVVELPTLEAEVGGERQVAVNDVVVASSIVGRMVELGWAVGGEDLGELPCDGVICCTPSG